MEMNIAINGKEDVWGALTVQTPQLRCPGWQRLMAQCKGHLWSWGEVVGILAPLWSCSVALGRLLTLSEPFFLICKIWRRTWCSAYSETLRRKCEQRWHPALSQMIGSRAGAC